MSLYPELEDLSTWMTGQQTVHEKLPDKVWRLPTPGDKGIFHAIMISYLISSTEQEIPERFKYRLTVLLGENFLTKSIQNSLKNNILHYNPFRNSDQAIFPKRVEKRFKENLNSYFVKRNKNSENSNISAILTAASSMLKCSIFLFKTNENHSKGLEIYQAGTVTPSSSKLYIFYDTHKEMGNKLKNTIGYGVTKNEAYPFRKDALKHILKLIKFDNLIDSFAKEIFLEDKFLITILRCSDTHVLNKVFNYPLITTALDQSGFKINPLITDENGLSAFFYAINKTDFSLILRLYDYAVDNFGLSEDSSRKPEAAILNVVERIRNLLENDKLITLNFSLFKNRNSVIHAYSQFIYFIEYQIDFIKKIIEIKDSNSYDKENKYIKYRKQVIIALIDTYKNYFYLNMQRDSPQDKFHNYREYNDYYTLVDSFFSYVFFEHFLSLRYYFNDNIEEICTDTVASLFLLIQSKMSFNRAKGSNLYREDHFQCYIELYYRENFLPKAEKLKAELEKIGNETAAGPKDVTAVVKSFLIDHPEISNIMIAGRVRHYLTIVLSMKNSKTFKRMLVMERALQVLGELIQNEGVTNCPIKHYLCSCLEDGAESKIMFFRNCLSHYKTNYIQGQLYIENNEGIFEKLHAEFKGLSEMFDRIDHLCKIPDIMISKAINEAKLYFKDAAPFLETHKTQFYQTQQEKYLKYEVSFSLLTKNMLNYILRNMEKMKTSKLIDDMKIKVVKNIVEAFIYLLDFVINCNENDEVENLKHDMESFKNINLKMKESYTFLQCETAILPLLEKCLDTVSRLPVFKNNRDPLLFSSSFLMKELHEKYQKYDVFNPRERNIIRKEMEGYLEKSKEAKEFCLNNLDTEDSNVLKKKLSIIVATKDSKRSIENFIDNNSKKRAKKCLEKIDDMTIDSIFKPGHTTNTILSMTTEVQRFLLLQLKFRGKFRLRKKIRQLMNQKISFLLNRIDKLEKILIREDKLIQFLWRLRKNENIKAHVKSLIGQRYLHKSEIRAAVEMLIMDCMGVFGDKEKDKELWVKAKDLFTDINLRDILAHGNPLVQRVSNILDPSDVVSALMDHVTELMNDKNTLIDLSILWFMQKETNLSDFIEFIKCGDHEISENCSKRDLKVQKLRKQITNSERWEKYVKLLPLSNKS
ncbi:uncharacterized protein [Parasteatoda tepidariorum]|uniref:uncharacterized protein isoform X1 n=1 Tax=Parasteatoda tepidariorum TaxID=114398 RepID=UPI001C722647|nr:uncharacterized protein LOC122271449 isoform X1 [Parasteatoda tepidariorum]